jgi:heat shock protein HslJ
MWSRPLNRLLLAALAAGIGATAVESIAQEPTGEAVVPVELDDTEWRLVDIDGRTTDADLPPVTLSFGPIRAQGSGGCNWYTAWLEAGAVGRFVVSHLAVTRRDCAHPRVMDREAGYLAALDGISGYRLTDGELALTYRTTAGEGRLLFTPD